MKISNSRRAAWAQTALDSYLEAKGEDDNLRDDAPFNIIDLVTDLLHLARKHRKFIVLPSGVKGPSSILETAKMHFEAESERRD